LFELSFIRKYLTPKKKQLSVSLIALLSVAVITLVVWLVVLFLSVTEGIEKTWLHKLTALNAPIRLQPTQEYFSSYYYNVDRYSEASQYMSKTLGQKARALISNPYNPEIDEALPVQVAKPHLTPTGEIYDPVKGALAALDELKQEYKGLTFQDGEMSGALLRLNLIRQDKNTVSPVEMERQLTNVSYLASFTDKNPFLPELILEPTIDDLNHLLFLSSRSNSAQIQTSVLSHSKIKTLTPKSAYWRFPIDLLPERVSFQVEGYSHGGQISHIIIPDLPSNTTLSTIEKRGKRLFFKAPDEPEIPLDLETPLFSFGALQLQVQELRAEGIFSIRGKLQKQMIRGEVPLEGLSIAQADLTTEFTSQPNISPLWPYFLKGKKGVLPKMENETGILLAKNLQTNGVKIGDAGYLAYSATTALGAKEHHIPIYVCGFYDPGIMAVGNKCILVPSEITQTINASENAFTLDQSAANHLLVWFPELKNAPKIKTAILQKLEERGLAKYWKVETFRDYEFAKDLMQQFQSDKYLFSLIAIIILLVACTNIISLLVLLVSDKKKEIGILRAMGAKRRSIAAIFACAGASLGLFSCMLGLLLAFITLKNIDHLVHFLSFIQGHDAFNAQFFGQSLPHEISPRALLFAAIATPVLALIAGLFPAIKAARMNPCESLRSE